MEYLHYRMGIQSWRSCRQDLEIAVYEFRQTPVVIDSSGTALPADKQFEAGNTERVLDIDGHQADPCAVIDCGFDTVCLRPTFGNRCESIIIDSPHLIYLIRTEMGRDNRFK